MCVMSIYVLMRSSVWFYAKCTHTLTGYHKTIRELQDRVCRVSFIGLTLTYVCPSVDRCISNVVRSNKNDAFSDIYIPLVHKGKHF